MNINKSLAEVIALLTPSERKKALHGVDMDALLYDWDFWARPKQKYPSGDWSNWLVMAGRGFGKTRIGAEAVRERAKLPNQRIGLIGATQADVIDVMVCGESGILAVCPDDEEPVYEKSRGILRWENGSIAKMYSAEKAARLRGPQHSALWCDELAAWQYTETWDMALMGLRLGDDPRAIITTTPMPTLIIKSIMNDPDTHVTTGSTYENSGNLAPQFIETIIKKYEGTRLGRQELYAEILDDNPNALWSHGLIEKHRVKLCPELVRIVVGIDPAVTSNANSDETGIIVVGIDHRGHVYVVEDASGNMKTNVWAATAVRAYHQHRADRIVPEVNNGGDLVMDAIRFIDPNVAIKAVRATKGKYTRAEPVAALYEQGRVHHVGILSKLEDQMTNFDPVHSVKSPDRLDALVHAITDLTIATTAEVRIRST